MLSNPHVTDSNPRPAAVIRFTIPRAEIVNVMGPAFGELMGVVAAQKVGPAGPFFSHHFKMDPEIFDFEVGVGVSAPIAESGRVMPGSLPAGRVARVDYVGGYEGLGFAWREFDAWIAEQGLKTAPNLWECYVRGPESGADSSTWRTELNRPLAD